MLHKYAKDWEWFWEVILLVHKSDIYCYNKPEGIGGRDWWIFSTPWIEHHNRWFKHPAQKPEKLLEHIIMASSNENDLVLDPFLGSGTTAVAYQKLHRNFIGCDINPDYLKIAQERLNRTQIGMELK